MILFLFVFCSCKNKGLPNEYIFSEPIVDWYVIVNGCKGGENFIGGSQRKFIFPKNGVFLADMKNFYINENDVFVVDEMQFDPNSKKQDSYKLCYYTSSLNSGYNAEYLSKTHNIPSLGEEVNPIQDFDLYFFRIGKSCDDEVEDLDKYFDKIWLYLMENRVVSSK